MKNFRLYALIVVAAMLGTLALIDRLPDGGGEPAAPELTGTASFDNPLAQHPLSTFDAILKRSLFDPRRAPTTDIVPLGIEAAGPSDLSGFDLVGIVLMPAASRALLRERATGIDHWIAVGTAIAGWSLLSVSPDTAVFGRGGVQLSMKVGGTASALASGGSAPATPVEVRAAIRQHPIIPTDAMLGLGGRN